MPLPSVENILKPFYAALDEELSHIKKSCRKGCHYCCYDPIYADILEAEYIKIHLKHLSPSSFTVITEEWRKWFDKYSRLDLHRNDVLTREQFMEQKRVLTLNKVKCPFLINNECSIYEVRPVLCRTFYSTGSPLSCNYSNHIDSETLCFKKNQELIALRNKFRPDFRHLLPLLPYYLRHQFS